MRVDSGSPETDVPPAVQFAPFALMAACTCASVSVVLLSAVAPRSSPDAPLDESGCDEQAPVAMATPANMVATAIDRERIRFMDLAYVAEVA